MPRPTLYLFIFSYAISKPPRTGGYPCMPLVDCTDLRPPPPPMCDRYTGLNPKIEEIFFSDPRNEQVFHSVCRAIKRAIRHWDFSAGPDLEIPVACKAGCHRSVAMAERLGREISCWAGAPFKLGVSVEHFNLGITVVKNKHRSRARYGRYRDLVERAIIGENCLVARMYRHGRGYNME